MAVRVSSIPPRSPRLPNAGDVVATKYRLERLLKQGGMGAVWIATHLGLDERVAIKFMDPRRVSSAEARMRFTREAKAAAQIRSKNIVQILDHGVDGNVPYIAMELLNGEDLGGRLRRVGRLSIVEASSLLEDIAHALDRAHAVGIVHRDLKPENIFLAKDGDHEIPKILDFGIALEVQADASDDSAATQEGVILGTPYFMSPEQVRGRANVDHRSDLWSVGVILFRAITGIRPFGRGAPADVIVQICSDPIPRASVVSRDLPEEVDRFFEKALARDVAKRFSSAKEMAAAFAEIAKLADAGDRTQPVEMNGVLAAGDRPTPPRLPGSSERPSDGTRPARAFDRTGTRRRTPPPLPVTPAPEPVPVYEAAKTLPAPGMSHAEAAGVAVLVPAVATSSNDVAMANGAGTTSLAPAAAVAVSTDGAAAPDAASAAKAAPSSSVTREASSNAATTTGDVTATSTATMTATSSMTERVATPKPASVEATTPRPPETAPPPSVVEAVTSVSESASHARSAANAANAAAFEEGRRSSSSERRGRGVWIGVLSAAAAAALIGFLFREKLFAPPTPSKQPAGATTIVLTAGTVVLMGPAGERLSAPAPQVSASADAAGATAAPPSPSTAPTAADSPTVEPLGVTTATPSTSPVASQDAPARSAKPVAARPDAKPDEPAVPAPQPTAEPKPVVEAKPVVDKPAAPAPTSTGERDLGY